VHVTFDVDVACVVAMPTNSAYADCTLVLVTVVDWTLVTYTCVRFTELVTPL
jgi:MinD superfamily P-loop ATPase